METSSASLDPTFESGAKTGSWTAFASIYLRLALGTAFLSAVADRFGIWGPPGSRLVAWGNFHKFLAYAARINPWFHPRWIPAVGGIATFCEIVFGIALIVGYRTRIAAVLSGLLLLAFAIGMAAGTGVKAPLDASVFTASAGAFLLAGVSTYRWSLDARRARKRKSGGHA